MVTEQFDPSAWMKGTGAAGAESPAVVPGQQSQEPTATERARQAAIEASRAGFKQDESGNWVPAAVVPVITQEVPTPPKPDTKDNTVKPDEQKSVGLTLAEADIAALRGLINKTDGDITFKDVHEYIETANGKLTAHQELLAASGIFINENIKAERQKLSMSDRDLAILQLKGQMAEEEIEPFVDKMVLADTLAPLAKGYRTSIEKNITAEEARLKSEHETRVAQTVEQQKPQAPDVERQEYQAAAKDLKQVMGVSLGKTDAEIQAETGKAIQSLVDGTFIKDVVQNRANMVEMAILWSMRDKLGPIIKSIGAQQGKADLLLNELGNARPFEHGRPLPDVVDGFDPVKFKGA